MKSEDVKKIIEKINDEKSIACGNIFRAIAKELERFEDEC